MQEIELALSLAQSRPDISPMVEQELGRLATLRSSREVRLPPLIDVPRPRYATYLPPTKRVKSICLWESKYGLWVQKDV